MRCRYGPLQALLLLLLLLIPDSLHGIPAFARRYGVSCNLCHATVPRLNAYGEAFAGNGFELVIGEEPRDTMDTGDPMLRLLRRIDLAFRADLFATLATPVVRDGANIDLQTPYGIKLLSGGVLADRISYYMYFYMSERGEIAGLEDAYIQFTDIMGSGVSAIVGQFQVSDPLFKRELRLQYEDYQPYRVRVGNARADLTYDRGIMLSYAPWEGGDIVVSAVNGRGLSPAAPDRHYDRDNNKPVSLRISQELPGAVRIGAFGYLALERNAGFTDRITIWGPDATVTYGAVEVNAQFLRRADSNPLFSAVPRETTVNSAMAEVIVGPLGPAGRWTVAGLYNWIDADAPLLSLRLGSEGEAGFSQRYHSAAAGLHYLLHRNVRFMGEAAYDIEQERTRLTIGTVLAF
jgi:hypothetical protein